MNADSVLLELGRALYVFQAIEVRLKLLLPHMSRSGEQAPPEGQGWSGRMKYLESKEMLGPLVKLFQSRLSSTNPDEIEKEWRKVVQSRNDVVHGFALQPFAGCQSPEDIAHALQYIQARRVRAIPMLQMLDLLAHGFIAALQLPPNFEGEVAVELPEWWHPSAA